MNFMRDIFTSGPLLHRNALATALALPSAVIGANFPATLDLPWFPQMPFLPGILFAIVVALIVGSTERPSRLQMFAVFVTVVIAWLCAYNAAVESEPLMARITASMTNATMLQGSRVDYSGILTGLTAGLVGSAITCLAVAFAAPSFRSLDNWTRTILVGTLAGTLLEFALSTTQSIGMTVLFVVWQCAMAVSIAYGLRPRTA